MSENKLMRKCLRTVAVYLVVVNAIDIIEKLIYAGYSTVKFSVYFNAPSILMITMGGIMWLIAKGIKSEKNDWCKGYLEYLTAGLLVLTNGFYKFINLIWGLLYFYNDRPNIMIGKTTASHNQSILTLIRLDMPRLIVCLIEIIIGLLLFLGIYIDLLGKKKANTNGNFEEGEEK